MIPEPEENVPVEEGLTEWKARMKLEFLDWLEDFDPERVEVEPEGEGVAAEYPDMEGPDAPDRFSLLAELTALRQEFRTAGRRSQETLGRFETALQGFERTVGRIGDSLADLEKDRGEERRKVLKPMLLSLIGALESLERLEAGLSRRPGRSWFGGTRPWEERWDGFQAAVGLVRANLEKLLQKEGIARIRTEGDRFDPARMRAVAAEPGREAGQVLRETAPGYSFGDEVLKIAEVVVAMEGEDGHGGE